MIVGDDVTIFVVHKTAAGSQGEFLIIKGVKDKDVDDAGIYFFVHRDELVLQVEVEGVGINGRVT